MTLRIYNVLGRQKQDFVPIEEGKVSMYVCGPTVYDHPHLGHAKNYTSFDIVVRWLRYIGYDVLYVQNITDVGHLTDDADMGEDKILKRASQRNAKPMQLVETYTRSFFEDMDALGNLRPDISPRASGHIPEQIKMIETLIEKGHAYEVNGSVYFDVTTKEDYGKLSNRRIDEQEGGAREVLRTDEKRNLEDFALWKKADPDHLLRWDSPWSEGFPGWHIECSAMAKKYLGETFDIHGGGIDNIYPHNENEIVQSECANDADFARYWMLVGSLTIDGVKMSKSLGNFITIKDALDEYRPEVIRMLVVSGHYSKPLDYSDGSLDTARGGWERIYNAYRLTLSQMNSAPDTDAGNDFIARLDTIREEFTAAMNDDFNTPQALAVLQELTRNVNTRLNDGAPVGKSVLEAIKTTYDDLAGKVLGILPAQGATASADDGNRQNQLIEMLIDMRAQARANKNFAESDRIRDQLAAIGVILEDRPDGTIWKVQ